jgi:hypothetical protein
MSQEGTAFLVVRLPFPWPPSQTTLIHSQTGTEYIAVWALSDGRITLSVGPNGFVSQPVDINSNSPRFVILEFIWSALDRSMHINGKELLRDAEGVDAIVLSAPKAAPTGISLDAPNADSLCQKWIQNRQLKFGNPRAARSNRRLKTADEQANDLRASVYRLRHLQQQVIAGNTYLLGTLAGEMRACVYWFNDTRQEANYNPLLLRMANLAQLPLPVYIVRKTNPVPEFGSLELAYEPGACAPRIVSLFDTDVICDLQEALTSTVLQLGHSANSRTTTPLNLIKELANTMGASHYDEDASDFLEILSAMQSAQGDHVMTLMCQTADALAALSEWVLSELKTRNLIA